MCQAAQRKQYAPSVLGGRSARVSLFKLVAPAALTVCCSSVRLVDSLTQCWSPAVARTACSSALAARHACGGECCSHVLCGPTAHRPLRCSTAMADVTLATQWRRASRTPSEHPAPWRLQSSRTWAKRALTARNQPRCLFVHDCRDSKPPPMGGNWCPLLDHRLTTPAGQRKRLVLLSSASSQTSQTSST